MGSNNRSPRKIICVMCSTSDETEITGALSTKGNISAHQNCLLFASGIYCKNSPTYDDLFGFEVGDVKKEMCRGKKLFCHKCKKRGATVGCEEKRCRRSYHYPCAKKDKKVNTIEDTTEGRYKLFCELHDPESEDLQEASTSGLNGLKKQRSPVSHKRISIFDSDSSSTSSDGSISKKKKSDSDDETKMYIHPELAPVETDMEECTPPQEHNPSSPDPKRKRLCEKLSSSAKVLLHRGSSSGQKACGPTDTSGELLDQQSTPVPGDTRPGENSSPLVTGADEHDIDFDTDDDSQSLLKTKKHKITVPCRIIVESDNSADPCSPASSAPAGVPPSPGSVTVPEDEETPSKRCSSIPRTLNFNSAPQQQRISDIPSDQPGSSQHSSPIGNMFQPTAQTLPSSGVKAKQKPKPPPAGASPSPDQPAAEDACEGETQSSAAAFWTRCNQAGCTKEIFSSLMFQLRSLGERVQSEEARPQDFEVALEVLKVSGQLPHIINQLEQVLEKQEQELQRRKAALRDARTALGDLI